MGETTVYGIPENPSMQEQNPVIFSTFIESDAGRLLKLLDTQRIYVNGRVKRIINDSNPPILPYEKRIFYSEVAPCDIGFSEDPLLEEFLNSERLAKFNRRPFEFLEGINVPFKIPHKPGHTAYIGVSPIRISEREYGLLNVFQINGLPQGKFLVMVPIDKETIPHYRIPRTSSFLLPFIEPPAHCVMLGF